MKKHQMIIFFTNVFQIKKRNNFRFLSNTRQGNNYDIVTLRFRKAPYSNCFLSTLKRAKPVFSNSSGLKSAFAEKLHFSGGLV